MAIVSVPKNVWTTIVTASTDTIIENMGHSEVYITTETPSLTGFKSEKLTITTIQAGQTAKVYSTNKPVDINYFSVAEGDGITDLGYTASTRILTSSTGADVTLPLVSSSNAGLTPASGGGTTNFLRADGSWVAPPGISNSFETVAKGLIASDYTMNYTGDVLDSIDYNNGVTKTFNYTGDTLTSIVLSGTTPSGIDLTKTFSYTGDTLTGVTYS